MFNRHLYQRLQNQLLQRNIIDKKKLLSIEKKKKKDHNDIINYKNKIRNFFVELASNPLQLGQYQPPINNIVRQIDQKGRFGAAQMFINGFKTNKQRLQNTFKNNKIIDYSPTIISPSKYQYRDRIFQKQIQPEMKFTQNKSVQLHKSRYNSLKSLKSTTNKLFNNQIQQNIQNNLYHDNESIKSSFSSTLLRRFNSNNSLQDRSNSLKSLRLPSIQKNPQKNTNKKERTYYKAIQQIGNSLKMMQQSTKQKVSLKNKLMNLVDGKDVVIQIMAMNLLKTCKLNKCKKGQTY